MGILTTLIHWIDLIFTSFIFIPAIYLLYCRVKPSHTGRRSLCRTAGILLFLYLLRLFCGQYIFTVANMHRFVGSGLFPLIEAVFYL